MKNRTFVSILILGLAVLIIAGSCATKKSMVKDSEELYGTWINEEYKSPSTPPFKIHVINPDGTMGFFRTETSVWEKDVEVLENGWIPCDHYTYTIENKWVDSDGNVMYKVEAIGSGYEKNPVRILLLMKISDSNNVLEYMVNRVDYDETIDYSETNSYIRRIYYRKE